MSNCKCGYDKIIKIAKDNETTYSKAKELCCSDNKKKKKGSDKEKPDLDQ